MNARTMGRAVLQRGFTLVELMISMALGLVLLVALPVVYTNVTRTNTEMARTNGMIENGRFAIDVVQERLSHAGFWGGYVPDYDNFILRSLPGDVPTQAALDLGPCTAITAPWTAEYKNVLIGLPIEVYDGLPPGCSSTVLADRKSNTDVLVVRHLEGCPLGTAGCHCLPSDAACYSPSSTEVFFQASFCQNEITANNKRVLSNSSADFILTQRGCATVAPIRKFVQDIYYIRSWSTTAGDGVPTLMRLTSSNGQMGSAQALIEGIEYFKVELGLDKKSYCNTDVNYTVALTTGAAGNLVQPNTCSFNSTTATYNVTPTVRGDGVPESYVRCGTGGCTVAQLMDVVAVKVYVLARSLESSSATGHSDTNTYSLGTSTITPTSAEALFKRHVFQTTVRLHNVSGRRETPTSMP